MNKTAQTVSVLHALSFTLFFILNLVLDYFVYPTLNSLLESPFWHILIPAVISAFLYSAIYFVLSSIYKLWVFKHTDKKLNISGKWYHVHIPYDAKGVKTVTKLRAGETQFSQNMYDVKVLSAKNDSFTVNENNQIVQTGDRHTTWSHPHVFILEKDEITIIYKAGATHNTKTIYRECPFCGDKFDEGKELVIAQQDRLGIHKLNIESDTCIIGEYRDASPSTNHGMIKFYRKKADRDNEILNYFNMIKYNS